MVAMVVLCQGGPFRSTTSGAEAAVDAYRNLFVLHAGFGSKPRVRTEMPKEDLIFRGEIRKPATMYVRYVCDVEGMLVVQYRYLTRKHS